MEDLIQEYRSYSDVRISNIIKQSHNYRPESIQAAKTIAAERNMNITVAIKSNSKLVREATTMLERDVPVNIILDNLIGNGADKDEAETAIFYASKEADLGRYKREEKKEKAEGSSHWWVIFVIIFVIRLVIGLARNN